MQSSAHYISTPDVFNMGRVAYAAGIRGAQNPFPDDGRTPFMQTPRFGWCLGWQSAMKEAQQQQRNGRDLL